MSKVDDALAVAMGELGKPYSYGDEGPDRFDCSGLVQWVYAHVGIKLPRTAAEQQRATAKVSNPLPGDLVFWGDPAYHVGIYLGGGKMIAAPDAGDHVKIQAVWGTPANYGRVSGLGTAVAPVVAPIGVAADTVASWLAGARFITIETAFAGLGLALVGYGLWRTVSPKQHIDQAIGELL